MTAYLFEVVTHHASYDEGGEDRQVAVQEYQVKLLRERNEKSY